MHGFRQGRIFTKRLELAAATPEHVLAELEDPRRLASLLNAAIEPGWPPGEYDRNAQEFFRERLLEGGPAAAGWYSWYAIRREGPGDPAVLVGAGGYYGPPGGAGEVEIGFSIMPPWRGLGFAAEMAEALIVNAFADPRVFRVVARMEPRNSASRRVLEKCRFRCAGDDEAGNRRYEILRHEGNIQRD